MTANKTSFRDIKKIILSRIYDRTWGPGDAIPRELELAEELGCARATINRAMRELADDGIIERKRKSGTRVRSAPVRTAKFSIPLVRSEIEESGSKYRYILLKREILFAPEWLRARLGLDESDRILHLRCMHYADGTPFQFEDRWINIRMVPAVEEADFKTSGPNEWLVNHVPYTNVEFRFRAGSADNSLAELLMVSVQDPVFVAERTTWLENNPVTFARMYFGQGYCMTTHSK